VVGNSADSGLLYTRVNQGGLEHEPFIAREVGLMEQLFVLLNGLLQDIYNIDLRSLLLDGLLLAWLLFLLLALTLLLFFKYLLMLLLLKGQF